MEFEAAPKAVLTKLGIKSYEEIWEKGTPKVAGRSVKHKNSGFAIGVDSKAKTFDGRVLSVLQKLHPHREHLKALCGEYHAELSIAAYVIGDEIPPLGLSKEAIKLLSDLEAEVDLDLYVCPEDE